MLFSDSLNGCNLGISCYFRNNRLIQLFVLEGVVFVWCFLGHQLYRAFFAGSCLMRALFIQVVTSYNIATPSNFSVGQTKPLIVQTVNRMLKAWTRAINLSGNYGAHSLRKSFGYVQRMHYGMAPFFGY